MMDKAALQRPAFAPDWTTFRRLGAGSASVSIERRDPVTLRLTIDLGFAAIVALGVEDVSDLIAGFSMADGERLTCHRYAFVLDEVGEGEDRRVVYRDKATEVRLTRSDYDRVAGIVSDLLADPRVQSMFEEAFRSHAVAVQASVWEPVRPEA